MANCVRNIEGHYYPVFHCGWSSCAEELFHHTSRYYSYTEAFLRNLSAIRNFSMLNYQAERLSYDQRKLLAAVLSCEPNLGCGRTITEIVTSVSLGEISISRSQIECNQTQMDLLPDGIHLVYKHHGTKPIPGDLSPLDPFLHIAERLRLPVAVMEHHVEVSLTQLAQHLDSPNPIARNNLQNALLQLHSAGYLLRNHRGLTHREARFIADEDAV